MPDEELKPSYTQIAVDKHLVLRQLEVSEAPELLALVEKNREHLRPWMTWLGNMKTAADSEKFIRGLIDKRSKNMRYGYGIIYDGRIAGHISLMHLKAEKDPEIGYWLDRKLNGRGIITQAVIRLTEFGLKTLGLNKIIIKCKPENVASNRVAEKCGFKLEATKKIPKSGMINVWLITK